VGIKVLAGDFGRGEAMLGFFGSTALALPKKGTLLGTETIDLKSDVVRVAHQTEESIHALPIDQWQTTGKPPLTLDDLEAEVHAAGFRKDVAFAVYLKDGRKFLAVADARSYGRIKAAAG
jgi:hypothetical protein